MSLNFMESAIVEVLKTVYDPEIPVNIWELGLVYEIKFEKKDEVKIRYDSYSSWLSCG